MGRMKLKALKEMNDQDLIDKLSDLKSELTKMRMDAAKGTLKKDAGKIRYYRRDIARILTILRTRGKKL